MNEALEQTIKREVSKAKWLFDAHSEALCRSREVTSSLAGYRAAILRTGEAMKRMGVVKGCTQCASKSHGSCCFSGIEEGFDHVLLLINLLLGCDIPEERELADGCFFVGTRGCRLTAKSYFCLHYLCPELQKLLGPSGSEELLRIVGDELSMGWDVEQVLREWFRSSTIEP
jgi:hypothetical protein